MKRIRRLVSCSFFAFALFSAAAQESSEWERAWTEAVLASPFAPSPLARSLAEAEIAYVSAEGLDPRGRFRRVFRAAMEIERALRFGASAQTARAELRRSLRLSYSNGDAEAMRLSERLKNAERSRAGRSRGAVLPSVPEKGPYRAEEAGAGKGP